MMNNQFENHQDMTEWLEKIGKAETVADLRKLDEDLTEWTALTRMPQQIQYKIRTALRGRWDDLELADRLNNAPPIDSNTLGWICELLGEPLFVGMLFMINEQETEEELASIRAKIDEQSLIAFGENGSELLNVYMNDRMRLLHAGIAHKHPGVNYILEHGIRSLEPQMTELVNRMADMQQLLDDIELINSKCPSDKKN